MRWQELKVAIRAFQHTEETVAANTCQQVTAAAYLAALVRYYALSDATARPYLSGAQAVEGLGDYGTSDVQVQAQGFGLRLPPFPRPTIAPPRP